MLTESVVLTLEIFQNGDEACRIQFAACDGGLIIRLINDDDVCIGRCHIETKTEIKALTDFLQFCYSES